MTAKLIRGRGIRRVLVRSLPLVVLDVAATVVAFLIAAWGTKAGEIDLASPFFMGQMALLSLVNVAVFGVFRMYNSLWEYASVDDAARIVLATAVGSVIGDVLGALVFDARMPFRVYICAWAILLVICGMARFAIRVNSKDGAGPSWVLSLRGRPARLLWVRARAGRLLLAVCLLVAMKLLVVPWAMWMTAKGKSVGAFMV